MKKIILLVAALTMVVSGIAAVSAYEAHLINVTAHVENALDVNTDAIEFGTVFPEEWIIRHRDISLSASAIAEKPVDLDGDLIPDPRTGDLEGVTVQAFAEWKPVPDGTVIEQGAVIGDDDNPYYPWLGEALYVQFNATGPFADSYVLVGPALITAPGAQPILASFILNGIDSVSLDVAIDVPVFEGYVNPYTDPTPKPSGLPGPSWTIPKLLPGGAPNPNWNPDGIDLGLDLKIQVTNISRFVIADPEG